MGFPLIAGAGLLAKGLFDYLGQRGAQDAERESRQLYNEWLGTRQGNVGDIIERLTAAGFDPFGPQTTTQTGATSGLSTTAFNERVNPFITPEYKELEGLFRGILEGRLASPTGSIPEGYVSAVARSANEGSQAARVAAQNLAARRGLSGEQTLSIAEPIETERVGRIMDAAANLPLLGRQLQNEDINLAAGLAKSFGTGTHRRGTSRTDTSGTSEATTTRPPDFNALLQFLTPPSPQAGMNVGPNPAFGVGSDLIGALLELGMGGGGRAAGAPV